MTSKLVTAFIDNGDKFESLEEAVVHFDGSGRVIEGIRRNEGQDANGLNVGNGFGFNSDDTQVLTFTVEYTVTEEYAVSLLPEPEEQEEEQDNGSSELEDGDVVRPSEPESDSGFDEGVEPVEPVETDVDEQPGGGGGEPTPDPGGAEGRDDHSSEPS